MNLRTLGRRAAKYAEVALERGVSKIESSPDLDIDVGGFSSAESQTAREILQSGLPPDEQLAQMKLLDEISSKRADWKPLPPQAGKETSQAPNIEPSSKQGTLAGVTTDLTLQASREPGHRFVGREEVMKQLETAFASTINRSAVLEGEQGVGTSTIIKELARRSTVDSDPLYGKKFLQMNMGNLMAGTSLRGQFEEKIAGLIGELKESKDDVVLVIDNLEQAVGAGSTSSSDADAAGFLAPHVANGDIQILGITTPEQADSLADSALGQVLTRISVREMSREQSVEVLQSMKGFFEETSGVHIDQNIFPELVKQADQSAPQKFLPGKAVELLDQAVARAKVEKSEELAPVHLNQALQSRQNGSEVLAKFGRDISEEARNGELGPFVGREKESKLMARTLLRSGKNSPVLIGEGGVGKTAVVEKLAVDMLKPEHPLHGKSIIEVSALALAEDPEKVSKLLTISKRDPNLVVFIDEIHMVMTDTRLANSLKPALANGELSVVGATTLKEYNQWVAPDGAMNRRFKQVYVPEPTVEETAEILQAVSTHFEKKQGVDLPDEYIPRIVELTHGTIPNRFQPDIGIDVLRDVIAEAQFDGEDKVTMKTVEEIVLEAVEASEALLASA